MKHKILGLIVIVFLFVSCMKKEQKGPIRGGAKTSNTLENKLEEAMQSVEEAIDNADIRINETMTRTNGEPEVQGETPEEVPNYDHIPKLDRVQYRLTENTLMTVVTIEGCEYILVEPLSKWTAVSIVHKENCQYHY